MAMAAHPTRGRMSKKAPDPEKPENHERWIVSYADMLTLLFALFVVLYATSDANPNKLKQVKTSIDRAFSVGIKNGDSGASAIFDTGGGLTGHRSDQIQEPRRDLNKDLGEFAKSNGLREQNPDQERLHVHHPSASPITCSSIQAAPISSPAPASANAEVANALKGLPNKLRVEGHTDTIPVNSPDFPTNWELSSARATRVLRFLNDGGGFHPASVQRRLRRYPPHRR